MTKVVVLGVPTTLGLARSDPSVCPGVAQLPRVLREAGLVEKLQAADLGDLAVLEAYNPVRDAASNVWNVDEIARLSSRVADQVEPLVGEGFFPLVLGGDCSVLLGLALALRRIGRYGLVFLDGHTDLYTPVTSASGQVAAMELWLLTGGGDARLSDMEGRTPLFDRQDVVCIGYRDHTERVRTGALDPADHVLMGVPFERVRAEGAARAAKRATSLLRSRGLDGLWIHLDVDVISHQLMPAVDSPLPGGLVYDELVTILNELMASGMAKGIDVTIYDPTLDEGGRFGRRFVEELARGLSG